jgi:membrane protease YdiL (CAAX protease family)
MSVVAASKDFIRFLRNPQFITESDDSLEFATLPLLYVIIFFLIIVVSSPLMILVGVNDMQHSIDTLMDSVSIWGFIFITVIGAPIMEELIFRWHLRRPLVLIFIICSAFSAGVAYLLVTDLLNLLQAGIIIAFFMALGLLLMYSRVVKASLDRFYRKHFGIVFYLTVIVFAGVHLSNFSELDNLYVAPILILPQAMVALFLGYVRMKKNILWSIYFHAFHNMIPISLFLLAPTE